MTASRPRLAIDETYISGLLEVAASILERHADRSLAEKAAAVERYWKTSEQHPELLFGDAFECAISDLNDAVVLHLNTEVAAVTALFFG